MKRIVLMVVRLIVFVPWWVFQLITWTNNPEKHTRQERFDLFRKIILNANRAGRVTIEVSGAEKLPEKSGYMLTPNHQGLFDVLAIGEATTKPFSVVMKKEVEKTPVLVWIYKLIGGIAIDRDDIRQGMQVILQVEKDLKNGISYLIFPEGTRSKNGNHIGTFKGGTYKAALRSKAPVVPVALINSYKPFDIGSIAPVTVKVNFLDPIYYEEYKDMKTTELAAEVMRRIEEEIARHPESFEDEEAKEAAVENKIEID